MDATTSFVLAVVAVVVSVLSVAASFAALRQFPRPFFVHRIDRNTPINEVQPGFNFHLTNMGKASAHDVRVVLRGGVGLKFQKLWTTVEFPPSQPMYWPISMVTGDLVTTVSAYGQVAGPEGRQTNMDLEFEVTWRQAPAMRRIRSKKYRVRLVDTNLFAYEEIDIRGWVRSLIDWLALPRRPHKAQQ